MIRVTEQAAEALKGVLEANDAETGHGVKLVFDPTGAIRLKIGAAAPEDEVMRQGEEPLLIVERRVAERIQGLVLDVEVVEEDGRPQKKLTLRPESFS